MPDPQGTAYVIVKVPMSAIDNQPKLTLNQPTPIQAMATSWEGLAWVFEKEETTDGN